MPQQQLLNSPGRRFALILIIIVGTKPASEALEPVMLR
jgi:hypothetical protein